MGSRVIVGKFRLLSGEDGFDDLPVDVGEAVVTALKFIGQLLVIEAEEVEDGGLEVVDVDAVFDDVEADFIAFAVADAGFDAPAGHPEGVGVGVVVAAPFGTVGEVALDERGASEFTHPDDEGVVEETAVFEIGDQGGRCLIGGAALVVELGGEGAVLIPAGVHELDKAGAAFDEATGEEAVSGVGARFVDLGAVSVEGGF